MKKLRNHLENIFLSLLNRWYFFQNISFKEKTCFFFPISILTQRRTVNFWTHVDRLFITSLLNKFHKWPLIFVGLKFSSAQIFITCEKSRHLRATFV